MAKRLIIIIVSILILFIGGMLTLGVLASQKNMSAFSTSGQILVGDEFGIKQVRFKSNTKYTSAVSNKISFLDSQGEEVEVDKESFAIYDDGSIAALVNGVLLDLDDLSDNFINNYTIAANMQMIQQNGSYVMQTDSGTMNFGENIWKLSDNRYLIQSPELKVYFSEEDIREVGNYVHISIAEDGIVRILTAENLWMTISPECYVVSEAGVKIYPVREIIDDGKYKLSLAKLSVDADDNIQLTDEEMRNQVVPEIVINTIDGKDGIDNESGEDGGNGVDGTKGDVGESGAVGGNGTTGPTGGAGKTGDSAPNGAAGQSAIIDTTTNSALPVMAISDWKITATTLSGAISIEDISRALELNGAANTTSGRYSGSVIIYNVTTGEKIICYSTEDASYNANSGITAFDFSRGNDEMFFSTGDGRVLKPDTAYRLSVVAYYEFNGTIFSREFITRSFYTDSMGITLLHQSSSDKSIEVKIKQMDFAEESVLESDVYLLSEEQNKDAAVNIRAGNYVGHYIITYPLLQGETGNIYNEKTNTNTSFTDANLVSVMFEDLTPNTSYVSRVEVKTDVVESLTTQELKMLTLKTAPTWTTKPSVAYNRSTGAFEVHRPNVVDTYGGIEKYTYTLYDTNENPLRTITTEGNANGAVSFFVDKTTIKIGEGYHVKVICDFNDNQKNIKYDLGNSDVITAYGDALPRLSLEVTELYFNRMYGTISLNLGNSSRLSDTEKITLHIYADKIYDKTIDCARNGSSALANEYAVSYDAVESGANIGLDLQNLYKNTNYSIEVIATVDIGDGNGSVRRSLGTVSFQTYAMENTMVSWQTVADSGNNFSVIAKLNVKASGSNEDAIQRASYLEGQVSGYTDNNGVTHSGQVQLALYQGTGTSKRTRGTVTITDEASLEKLYSDGLAITEATFSGLSLTFDESSVYSLAITQVADRTVYQNLGYVNESVIDNATTVVTLNRTPPALSLTPNKEITATPIYNSEAVTYGAVVNEDLPSDTIIGYLLKSNYDNSQRLGYSVTYYGFEYSQFYDSIYRGGANPIDNTAVPKIWKVTVPIDPNQDTVPMVAVLFGSTTTAKDWTSGAYYNKAYVYKAPTVTMSQGALQSGMDRGFRYAFAYTARYSAQGSFIGEAETDYELYPNTHNDYGNYIHSCGTNGVYIFNSGMVEAPRQDPMFRYIVKKQTGGNSDTDGTLTIAYIYEDYDHTIVDPIEGGATGSTTKISFTGIDGNLVYENVGNKGSWSELTAYYSIDGAMETQGLVTPIVSVNRYLVDYDYILQALQLSRDVDNPFYLAKIPVEKKYSFKYSDIYVEADTSSLKQNILKFEITSDKGSASINNIYKRSVALKVIFRAKNNPLIPEYVTYLPIQYSGGSYFASIATGKLTQFLEEPFSIEASIIYDTGEQGWDQIVDKDPSAVQPFALQYTSKGAGSSFENIMGNYMVLNTSSPQSSTMPSGSLLILSARINSENSLFNLANTALFNTTSGINNSYQFLRHLYPTENGMDFSTSGDIKQISNVFAVPKVLDNVQLSYIASETNEITISNTTPIFSKSATISSLSEAAFESFTIKASDQLDAEEDGKYRIHFTVFERSEYMANGLNAEVVCKDSYTFAGTPKDGTYSEEQYVANFEGLTADSEYYIVVTANINGTQTILMDEDTVQQATYLFNTRSSIAITPNYANYFNRSYFNKQLEVQYALSSTYGFKIHYDIFDTQTAAEKNENPILGYQELLDNNMLTAPSGNQYSFNNLKVLLEPSSLRSKLIPGKTYYLRISAVSSTEVAGDMGYNIVAFNIPAVSMPSAYIYAKAQRDSVEFSVSVADTSYALMGQKLGTNQEEDINGGIYMVRFLRYDDITRKYIPIRTVYDDKLYYSSTAKQQFILDNSNLHEDEESKITSETLYYIVVYSPVDQNHDGMSDTLIEDSSGQMENRDWKWFYENSATNFKSVVKRINTSDERGTDKNLEITRYGKQTTDEHGISIGKMYLSSNGSTARFVLSESSGVYVVNADGNEVCCFQKISYTITGATTSGAVNYTNTITGNQLLKKGKDSADYDIYYIDLPETLSRNMVYTITVQLYQNTSDLAPHTTYSTTLAN